MLKRIRLKTAKKSGAKFPNSGNYVPLFKSIQPLTVYSVLLDFSVERLSVDSKYLGGMRFVVPCHA